MKAIILGSNGQLGSHLLKELDSEINIIYFSKNDLDITDYSSVQSQLDKLKPDFIINAAAFTNVEKAENEVNLAYQVNSYAVKNLAELSFKRNITLIHYSTDYIFDGKKKGRYYEHDYAKPLNTYGLSKLKGESYIKQSNCKYYIFRTSWIVSNIGKNFAKSIFNKLVKNEKIEIVYDQIGVPTSAELIAKVTKDFIKNYLQPFKFQYGIYNLTPNGKSSFFEIAKYLAKNIKVIYPDLILEEKIIPIKTINYPSFAKRPLNSLLDTRKIESVLNYKLPSWESDFAKVIVNLIDDR